MSIAGYPMDHGDQGPHDDGRATPAEPPPDDWNAQFTAIVSGISGSMRWEATGKELDETAESDASTRQSYTRAPDSIWATPPQAPDTADDRRLRREMRRQERAAELAAFQQAQAELEAARAADTEHYVPPPPPPLPRFRRRTVGALLLMVVGIVLIISPSLLPAPFELIAVFGLLLLLGGIAMLVAGMRRHRGQPGNGWDDGAEV